MIRIHRKIHLWAIITLIFLYVSLGVFLYTYFETHGKSGTVNKLSILLTTSFISMIVLGVTITGSIVIGIIYLIYISDSPQYYKNINILNGILLLIGGLGISLLISIFLIFNE